MDYINIAIIVVMMLVFYIFFILPQKKQEEQRSKFLEELKKGDDIVMLSGLCGKFCYFNDNKVTIEVDDHSRKLEFLKDYINVDKTIEISKPNIVTKNKD